MSFSHKDPCNQQKQPLWKFEQLIESESGNSATFIIPQSDIFHSLRKVCIGGP